MLPESAAEAESGKKEEANKTLHNKLFFSRGTG